MSPPHCRVNGHWEDWKGQARPAHPEAGQGQGSVQICVDTGSHSPKANLCSQCCQTGKSWGQLLVTLVPDKLLMGTGEAQIQFFVWVYQAVTLPVYLYSCLCFSLLCTSLLIYPGQHQ